MRTHRKNVVLGVAAVLAAGSLAACSSSKSTPAASGPTSAGAATSSAGGGADSKAYVGVILPDSASSDRWETQDRRP